MPAKLYGPDGRRYEVRPRGTLLYRRFPLRMQLDVDMAPDELRELIEGLAYTFGPVGLRRIIRELTEISERGEVAMGTMTWRIVGAYKAEAALSQNEAVIDVDGNVGPNRR